MCHDHPAHLTDASHLQGLSFTCCLYACSVLDCDVLAMCLLDVTPVQSSQRVRLCLCAYDQIECLADATQSGDGKHSCRGRLVDGTTNNTTSMHHSSMCILFQVPQGMPRVSPLDLELAHGWRSQSSRSVQVLINVEFSCVLHCTQHPSLLNWNGIDLDRLGHPREGEVQPA
jgi:hypothetical protein